MSAVVLIMQARMTSTRLPGKVLLPIAGRPMLDYQIERLQAAKEIDRIVVATTTNNTDGPIVEFCAQRGISCTRGPEDDVLARYAQAAEKFGATTVVRVTSDCPLIEPKLIDEAVQLYLSLQSNCDYVSNMLKPTWPYGMAVEVFSAQVLYEANTEASDPGEREHVTPFIYWRPTRYKLKSMMMSPDLSHHRWTVDTIEDFQLIERILSTLYPVHPNFQISDVIDLLAKNPDWVRLNQHIVQKTVIQA